MCCKFNDNEEANCKCCLCDKCQIDYDESPDISIGSFIQSTDRRHNQLDEESESESESEDEEGYSAEDSDCSTSASEGDEDGMYDEDDEYY
jgi:hypothetical protein